MTGKKPKDLHEGSIHKTNKCGFIEVVKYTDAHHVLVRFLETGYEVSVKACVIRTGAIQDRLAKTAFGVGYLGVGDLTLGNSSEAGWSWRSMLSRCYSDRYLSEKSTYRDCTVDIEWHNFQAFAKWHLENYPDDGEKYHLDKDLLLVGNRVYSPKTCVFIPQWLNSFMSGAGAIRGDYLIGVSFSKAHGKFEAYCNHDGMRVHLGLHKTECGAHQAWVDKKTEIAKEKKSEMDKIDVRIYPNVITLINTSK
ncbi:hypothetical protein NVP1100O_67 [Vibrio phage 1.100.O._10N.261.45.C3]|nr:hypothetical protein NVP1086O_66 [Vibrio phage 1.086.O._10N.222.51.F8]AUR87408.1 hypothetical protein NVP1100O_67 [Vibrio phage 1.100.O._10N.261.45.C3]